MTTPTPTAAARVSGTIKTSTPFDLSDKAKTDESDWSMDDIKEAAKYLKSGMGFSEFALRQFSEAVLGILAAIQPDPEPKPVASTSVRYRLEWLAGARPPAHPEPMKGSASFDTAADALAFFARQADDAKLLSLTRVDTVKTDYAVSALATPSSAGMVSVEEAARPISDVPEDGTWALLYPGYYGPVTACTMNGEWSLFDDAEKPHVTHWFEIQPALRALAGEGGR